MKRPLITATAALALGTGAVRAGPIGFGSTTDEELYTIDFGTGSATLIGGLGGLDVQGLAMDASGNLFGTVANGSSLYSFDPSTGAATLIGSHGLGNVEGLDFNGETLIAVDYTNDPPPIYELDTSTAAATLIVTADTSIGLVRSMTVLDANTVLVRSDMDDALRTIDLNTGETNILASDLPEIHGMDTLSDGNLYGVCISGMLYRINPANGQTTLIGDTGAMLWLDLTAAGQFCPWDCGDMNGTVGTADLLALLSQWGGPGSCDFDGDMNIGTSDLLELLSNWGSCPE
jgi:outer membrane protein assembly factor BamB